MVLKTHSSKGGSVGSLYFLNVTLHVLAALFWLGGMFFLGLVGAPALRQLEAPLRARLFLDIGLRFRTAGWIAITVLVVTGIGNLHFRGLLTGGALRDAGFWASGYGQALGIKVTGVLLMIALGAVHDFSIGPASGRAVPGSPEAERLRRKAAWMARLNALLGLIVVAAAVRISR